MGKKIISFSLWGDAPIYNVGAIRNAEMSPEIYPGWICRFYLGSDVPQETENKLKEFNHVEVVNMDEENDWQGMFWRFFAVNNEEDIDYVIFRDTDSRLTFREYEAVTEWVVSEKYLHIMRDHPYHSEPIMGGMWGCKPKEIINKINEEVYRRHELPEATSFKKIIEDWMAVEWNKTERGADRAMTLDNYFTKGIDQRFLRGMIYQLCSKDAHVQDAFPMYNCWSGRFDLHRCKTPKETNTGFPSIRGSDWNNFVGQVYDENDVPNEEYANLIKTADHNIYMDIAGCGVE